MIPYSLFVSFAYIGIFFFFYYTLPYFFSQKRTSPNKKSFTISLLALFFITFFSIMLSQIITDPWWANRVQHSLGGGFAAFFAYGFAMKESGMQVPKVQYYVFGFLLITALGVANELLESIVQYQFGIIMAGSITDTWLDLWSNTVGVFLAMGIALVYKR